MFDLLTGCLFDINERKSKESGMGDIIANKGDYYEYL